MKKNILLILFNMIGLMSVSAQNYEWAKGIGGPVDQNSMDMAADSEGNVYLSGKGVTVFNPAGKKIEQIPIDAPWTANMCFGGKDHRTLFITATQNLFSLRMRVQGAGSQ